MDQPHLIILLNLPLVLLMCLLWFPRILLMFYKYFLDQEVLIMGGSLELTQVQDRISVCILGEKFGTLLPWQVWPQPPAYKYGNLLHQEDQQVGTEKMDLYCNQQHQPLEWEIYPTTGSVVWVHIPIIQIILWVFGTEKSMSWFCLQEKHRKQTGKN